MKIRDVRVVFVEIPQVEPIAPYRSHVRTSSTTCSAIVRVEGENELVGWGEYNINFRTERLAARDQQAARDWFVGRDAFQMGGLQIGCPLDVMVRSGVEMALWDLLGRTTGRAISELLGGVIRRRIELAACMGIQNYDNAGRIAQHYVDHGYSTLKTKAGAEMDEDVEMVRGVRDRVGDALKLRIDPNRAYTPEQGLELAKRLEPYRLEYLEQPIPAEPLSDAADLMGRTTTPIALNESVTDLTSAWRILHAEAADFLLPDTHIAGGIGPCVAIGRLCEAANKPCIMHCGHDLGVKTAAMLHVAAASPSYSLANDSTYYGLADDVLAERLVIDAGAIDVPTGPGLGVDVDERKLEQYAIESPTLG